MDETTNDVAEELVVNQTKNYIDDILERISGDFNVYVKNLRTNKVFYEHKADELVDCSHLLALPILYGTMNTILDKKVKLKDTVNFKKKSDNTLTYIVERGNNKYTVNELLEAMCITNDKNALSSLEEFIGDEKINKFLDGYGLSKKYGKKYNESMQNLGKLLEFGYKGRMLTPRLCNMGIKLMQRNRDGNSITRQIIDDIVVAQLPGDNSTSIGSVAVIQLDHVEYLVAINTRNTKNALVARRLIGLVSRALYDEFNAIEEIN